MASSTRTVNVKFDGDAKGLQRAAQDGEREVDRFSKSVDKRFRKSGDDSGKGFTNSLKKWFSDSGGLKDTVGAKAGTLFGSGFLGALKTPVLGPAIGAALVAAVAVALPAVGAIAASGLVAGFGAGLVGLGVVFAARSQKVKDAWQKTLKSMGDDMSKLSKPFEASLISIAGFAQRTFDKFKPSLEAVFKDLAPVLTKFVDQVARGIEKLQPAIRPMADAFSAVLSSLGPSIQGAIGNVSNGLVRLADSVKKNPDGLADLVDGLGDATEKTLDLVAGLNDLNGKIKDLTGGTSAVDLAFGKANSKIGEFLGYANGLVNPLSGLKDGLHVLSGSGDEAGNSVADLGAKATLTGGAAGDMGAKVAAFNAAAGTAGKGADGLGPKIESLATKFERQWQATQKANQELFRNSGLLLTLSGSEIGYQAAVDAVTESIKQNGKTHDINTEKGRANKLALDQSAAAANAQSESSRNAGKASVAAATSAQKAYEKQAVQMGYTKQEAHRMAQEFIKIPPKVEADFKGDITDLESKIKTAKQKLKDPNLTKERKAELKAEISKLEAGVQRAKDALSTVPKSKTTTINVVTKYTTVGSRSSSGGVGGGREVIDKHQASGGLIQPRTRRWVGERGPEILEMGGQGGRILSAEQSTQALAGGSQPLIVENHIEIGGEVVRVVRTEIKQNDANTKRRVQAGVRA